MRKFNEGQTYLCYIGEKGKMPTSVKTGVFKDGMFWFFNGDLAQYGLRYHTDKRRNGSNAIKVLMARKI
jgi:hypothetical protein